MTRERKRRNGYQARGVIDRIEDRRVAVIILDDGQELHWNASQLPPGAKEGTAVVIALAIDVQDTAKRMERSRELLKDIFTQ